jgi:hypothetical protein
MFTSFYRTVEPGLLQKLHDSRVKWLIFGILTLNWALPTIVKPRVEAIAAE